MHACIDTFTSLDDLKPKERRDPEAVLAVLRRAGRFSAWDMDNRALRETVCALQESGRIVTDTVSVGFPWIAVTVPAVPVPREVPQQTQGGTDPRTLDKVVRRVALMRQSKCTVRTIQAIVNGLSINHEWMPCGAFAHYASVRKGRVSPRCDKHAKSDAKRWGVTIDENPAIEVPRKAARRSKP